MTASTGHGRMSTGRSMRWPGQWCCNCFVRISRAEIRRLASTATRRIRHESPINSRRCCSARRRCPMFFPNCADICSNIPNAALPGADSYFYWEKVDFGLKPTIRLNHAVIYRGRTQGRDFATVAIKQLYATHYFHTALDVSVCVQDGAAGSSRLLPADAERVAAGRADRRQGFSAAKGCRRQDAHIARTRTRLHQANGRTLGGRRLTCDVRFGGHSDAHRCCAKSLIGITLMGFGVRQHARSGAK